MFSAIKFAFVAVSCNVGGLGYRSLVDARLMIKDNIKRQSFESVAKSLYRAGRDKAYDDFGDQLINVPYSQTDGAFLNGERLGYHPESEFKSVPIREAGVVPVAYQAVVIHLSKGLDPEQTELMEGVAVKVQGIMTIGGDDRIMCERVKNRKFTEKLELIDNFVRLPRTEFSGKIGSRVRLPRTKGQLRRWKKIERAPIEIDFDEDIHCSYTDTDDFDGGSPIKHMQEFNWFVPSPKTSGNILDLVTVPFEEALDEALRVIALQNGVYSRINDDMSRKTKEKIFKPLEDPQKVLLAENIPILKFKEDRWFKTKSGPTWFFPSGPNFMVAISAVDNYYLKHEIFDTNTLDVPLQEILLDPEDYKKPYTMTYLWDKNRFGF